MGAGSSAAAVRIPYLYNGIEHVSDLGLDINTALFRTLDPALGRWWQIDPKAEVLKSLSPYNAMNNNPILLNDPNGDIPAFILPTIGWSKNGGFSIGLEIGVGVPGVLSASLSVGYNFGSRSSSWSVQGYASGFYAGYGSQGAFGGWGYRYAGFSVGASYGQAGLGIGI